MQRIRMEALLSGAALVLSGSAAALWLPANLVTALGLLILIRTCWLEENIRGDLMSAKQMPEGYRHTQQVQQRWRHLLFGSAPEEITCPQRLASRLRVQAHAHYALLLGAAGAGVASVGAPAPLPALLLGGACLYAALRRVERLAAAEAMLVEARALPCEMLEDRGPVARFLCNRPPDT